MQFSDPKLTEAFARLEHDGNFRLVRDAVAEQLEQGKERLIQGDDPTRLGRDQGRCAVLRELLDAMDNARENLEKHAQAEENAQLSEL